MYSTYNLKHPGIIAPHITCLYILFYHSRYTDYPTLYFSPSYDVKAARQMSQVSPHPSNDELFSALTAWKDGDDRHRAELTAALRERATRINDLAESPKDLHLGEDTGHTPDSVQSHRLTPMFSSLMLEYHDSVINMYRLIVEIAGTGGIWPCPTRPISRSTPHRRRKISNASRRLAESSGTHWIRPQPKGTSISASLLRFQPGGQTSCRIHR